MGASSSRIRQAALAISIAGLLLSVEAVAQPDREGGWTLPGPFHSVGELDGLLVLGTENSTLLVDSETGETVREGLGGSILAGVLMADLRQPGATRLDPRTGERLWTQTGLLSAWGTSSMKYVANDDTFIAYRYSYSWDFIGALDLATGGILWTDTFDGPPSRGQHRQLEIHDGRLYIRWSHEHYTWHPEPNREHYLAEFDVRTGERAWVCDLDQPGMTSLLITGDGPKFWNSNAMWSLVDPENCEWTREFEFPVATEQSTFFADDRYFFHDHVRTTEVNCWQESGRVRAFSSDGELEWETVLPGHFGPAYPDEVEVRHGRVLVWYEIPGWAYELDVVTGDLMRSTFLSEDGRATLDDQHPQRVYLHGTDGRVEVTSVDAAPGPLSEVSVSGTIRSEDLAGRDLSGLRVIAGETAILRDWCLDGPADTVSNVRETVVAADGTFSLTVEAREVVEVMLIYDEVVLARLVDGQEPTGEDTEWDWVFLAQEPVRIPLNERTELVVDPETSVVWERQMRGCEFDGQYVPRFARVWREEGATRETPHY